LPYTTGFDNAAQQSGWTQYRTGHISTYDWGISGGNSPSAPNHLYHDYPVGGASTDTVRDWYVSPPFDFSAGASMTLKANVYTITGSTLPSDGLKVMLLVGSANPALATVSELRDLLPLVTSTQTYTQVAPIAIPPTAGTSRIALYYQATNNWNTPGIDDIAITPVGVGIGEAAVAGGEVGVQPNPSSGPFTIVLRSGAAAGNLLLRIVDARGALVVTHSFHGNTHVDASLAPGRYHYMLTDERGAQVAQGKVMVE
jgi:hypothetical protein